MLYYNSINIFCTYVESNLQNIYLRNNNNSIHIFYIYIFSINCPFYQGRQTLLELGPCPPNAVDAVIKYPQ